MDSLKKYWEKYLYSAKHPEISEKGFRFVLKKYREWGRFYHNETHLRELFGLFEVHFQQLKHPENIAISIFFHDIVYNVLSKQNESKSAEMANIWLDKLELVYPNVYDYILATKNHCNDKEDTDLDFFLDFDLAVLGKSDEAYRNYFLATRKEYRIFPTFLYKKGRIQVLKHLLASKYLYKTPTFRDSYEEQARKNMEAEIRFWEQK